jgi:ribosomal-protein-alanine N-acetyltransferase
LEIKLNHTKCSLVPISSDHLEDLFDVYKDSELCHSFGIEPHDSKVKTQKVIDFMLNEFENKTGVYFSIKSEKYQKIIGIIGLNKLKPNRFAEIGFGISSKYKNEGIITEAVNEIVQYGFSYFNLNRIEAQTNPENIGCIKVLKKNDFKKEGHLKENFFLHGNFIDTLIFGLLKKKNLL